MADPKLFSINQLSELTQRDRRTITKKLSILEAKPGPANGKYYELKDALPLIFAPDGTAELDRRLLESQYKYEDHRAEKMRLEVERLKGQLVYVEDVASVVQKEYTYVRSQLLSIPSKVAKSLSVESDPSQVKAILDDAINEVLSELKADVAYEGPSNVPSPNSTSTGDESESSTSEVEAESG